MNENVSYYDYKGNLMSNTWRNNIYVHVSERDNFNTETYSIDNLHADYASEDFFHNDCSLFYESYDSFG